MDEWASRRGHRGLLAFSKIAGVSNTALAEYIREETEPGAWALWRISDVSGKSLDWLVRGGDPPGEPTAERHVALALMELRAQLQRAELPEASQRRYADLLRYIGMQMRRLIFDARRYLTELNQQSRNLKFDAEEFRREWLDSGGSKDE